MGMRDSQVKQVRVYVSCLDAWQGSDGGEQAGLHETREKHPWKMNNHQQAQVLVAARAARIQDESHRRTRRDDEDQEKTRLQLMTTEECSLFSTEASTETDPLHRYRMNSHTECEHDLAMKLRRHTRPNWPGP